MAAGPLEDAIASVQDMTPTDDQPAPPPASSDTLDPDAAELAAARAELDAETGKAPPSNDEATPPAGTGTTDETPPPANTQPTEKGPVPMIPKPRLDEVIREREEAQQKAAYLQGQLDALKAAPQSQQPPAAPTPREPTPLEKIGQAQAAMIDLAKQFDNGDLTYADMKAKEFRLQAYIDQVKEADLLARVPAPAPQGDSLTLDNLTAQLEEQHPEVLLFQTDRDFNYLQDFAKERLNERGVALDNSDRSKLILRTEIARAATELAPRFYPGQVAAKPAATPTPPAPSAAALARAGKLALQDSMPPDLSTVTGQTSSSYADTSPASIENMSDDEILANLPRAARDNLLGITRN